jgi:hypothetical protein
MRMAVRPKSSTKKRPRRPGVRKKKKSKKKTARKKIRRPFRAKRAKRVQSPARTHSHRRLSRGEVVWARPERRVPAGHKTGSQYKRGIKKVSARLKAAKTGLFSVVGICVLLALYIGILCVPEPFFRYSMRYNQITLYSDRVIPKNTAGILQQAEARIKKSGIYDPFLEQRIFLCNNRLRFLFFANTRYRVGGINYVYLNRNIFLRESDLEKDRMIGPSGHEVRGERTFTYYLAHEMVHGLEVRKSGRLGYSRMPVWIVEGYADYIAKGKTDLKDLLKKYRQKSIEMDPVHSGLYLRYQLFVAWLIEKKGTSFESMNQYKNPELLLPR